MDITCPEYHVWFITVRSKETMRIKCKFCDAEAKVDRIKRLSPTDQLEEIMLNHEARKDPAAYTFKPENVFD